MQSVDVEIPLEGHMMSEFLPITEDANFETADQSERPDFAARQSGSEMVMDAVANAERVHIRDACEALGAD